MAKKKLANRKSQPAAEAVELGKVVFQVRLEAKVHEKLKQAAEAADLSLNQLVQGILWAAADHLKQGRPKKGGEKIVWSTPEKRCVWFGTESTSSFKDAAHEVQWEHDSDSCEPPTLNADGTLWFGLDFSERGYFPG